MSALDTLLDTLKTPCLLLDHERLQDNCARMAERMRGHGVRLRPHLKTAKSAAVAELATRGQFGGITVSTLAEARYFSERGFRDITYAVGIVPGKVEEAAQVVRAGCRLTLLTDDPGTAREVAAAAASFGVRLPMLIEIDTGGGRAGVDPDDEVLLEAARVVHGSPGLALEGVLTHAGHSYHTHGIDEVVAVAEQERSGVVRAAQRIRGSGLPCSVVSAGSTPTARHAASLDGVTEMRPGVYMFGDLDQVALGSLEMRDIALSVLATVIGHNRRTGRILIDAGGLALSKDTSAATLMPHVGYGRILDRPTLYVDDVHQEHGLVAAVSGEPPYAELPIGAKVRILPNHACMTAAAYDCYHVIEDDRSVLEDWDRVNGW